MTLPFEPADFVCPHCENIYATEAEATGCCPVVCHLCGAHTSDDVPAFFEEAGDVFLCSECDQKLTEAEAFAHREYDPENDAY